MVLSSSIPPAEQLCRTFMRAITALVLAVPLAAHAQTPTLPGSKPLAPRPISFTQAPDDIVALPGDREGFLDLAVIGPAGVQIGIKSIENITIGTQRADALFSLVDPPPQVAPASGGPGVLSGAVVNQSVLEKAGVSRTGSDNLFGSAHKRLRYAGVPGLGSQVRVVRIEIVGSGGGARAVGKAFSVVLGPDSGAPVIKLAGAAAADSPEFPPFAGSPANNNGWNVVKTAMAVQIDAQNFTIPVGTVDAEQRAAYRVIAEYEDGAKFTVSYSGAGRPANVTPGTTRTIATVPNIGHGGFRIALATPAGTARDTRQFTFPDNVFTTHPVTLCQISFIGVDVPASAPTENSFWSPITFDTPALPAQRTCGKLYGEWDDVDVESTTMTPAGVAAAKIARRPTKGSVAHNGNMPAFTCSAAGLGSVLIHWRAKLRIFTGECPDRRVQ